MAYKASKNLLASRDTYNRYYGDFRGVDFSSDHTMVHEQRLAYSVNMYKDYQSKQGVAIETIPGFRRRFYSMYEEEVYGIHKLGDKVLAHIGQYLYQVDSEKGIADNNTQFLSPFYASMNKRKSVSFVFHNRLYILDGQHYLVYDGIECKDATENAYIPTTYISAVATKEDPVTGEKVQYLIRKENEQRNILQPKFRETFYADGETKKFYLSENNLSEYFEVFLYGTRQTRGVDYSIDYLNGKIEFINKTPKKPQDVGYPEGYQGIEVVASKTISKVDGVVQVTESNPDITALIKDCTIATVFDNRVFLSGNPNYPCHIFWSTIASDIGLPDPSYFGMYDHAQDGVNVNAPITGMVSIANTLMVLKADSEEDGCVFYHTPTQTEDDIVPVTYPSEQGLHGIGCLGACVNFLDDPVFVSRLGLEAMGQLSVRYERAMEHRSTLVDAKLTECDLSKASLTEWNGYLILLADNGKVFMADSRQRYTDAIGNVQYEWYYLEGVGIYDGQYMEWRYATENKYPNDLKGYSIHPTKAGQIANPPKEDGTASVTIEQIYIDREQDITTAIATEYGVIEENGVTYLCEMLGINNAPYIGGTFHPATIIKEIDGNLFFGTDNGVVCSFNFDKRNEYGEIPPEFYDFDGRTIFCGAATKMDNCGIPHLTKDTVKKSTVIKTKTLLISAAKVKVRTNKKPYNQIQRIGSATLDFNYLDFSDFSFETVDHNLFAVREKEKKWVEKQYFVYSDEYRKPFALYYIAFRYSVAGRYKD